MLLDKTHAGNGLNLICALDVFRWRQRPSQTFEEFAQKCLDDEFCRSVYLWKRKTTPTCTDSIPIYVPCSLSLFQTSFEHDGSKCWCGRQLAMSVRKRIHGDNFEGDVFICSCRIAAPHLRQYLYLCLQLWRIVAERDFDKCLIIRLLREGLFVASSIAFLSE